MAVTFNNVVSTTLTILNTRLTDPYNGTRVGSFFFDNDHEVIFGKYMPKGQVTYDSLDVSNNSFGLNYSRDQIFRVNVHFFTKRNDVGSGTNLKNRALVEHYIESIKNTLITNTGSYGAVQISFDTIERPIFIENEDIFVGTVPVIFKTHFSS